MARNTKCRRVCAEPENRMFFPEKSSGGTVNLAVEELEAVRLCDLEGLDQDKAAESMNISRGTLQRILYESRRKITEALCTGKRIVIDGGHYEITGKRCDCPYRCKDCRLENPECLKKKEATTDENCRNHPK